jgi:hypothetical protein
MPVFSCGWRRETRSGPGERLVKTILENAAPGGK